MWVGLRGLRGANRKERKKEHVRVGSGEIEEEVGLRKGCRRRSRGGLPTLLYLSQLGFRETKEEVG
jgi:hypothetical protein